MSSSDVVIRVEGLGKKYTLHHQQAEGYRALRDVIAEGAKAAGRRLNPFSLAGQLQRASRQGPEVSMHPREEEFWALKDVSFEIRRGERVGIIGRNGAGKSTLLKILSRITEPTTGRVEICGRVASLLEVGTGFHPELTGRENIYLNGAILGMTRREIRHKFDEIVAFAEVERFLDTPVKRFSSGMYVRLAFAVAAHLEPEILVVDEVLAVGDAGFQKKCLGKLEEVADRQGRTVLFVSHQMASIEALCLKGYLLNAGAIALSGEISSVVRSYLALDPSASGRIDISRMVRSGTGVARFKAVYAVDKNGSESTSVPLGSPLRICFELVSDKGAKDLVIGFSIHDNTGQSVAVVYSDYDRHSFSVPGGSIACRVYSVVMPMQLSPSRYTLGVRMIQAGLEVDWPRESVFCFDVVDSSYYGNPSARLGHKSLLSLRSTWQVVQPQNLSLSP